MSSQLALMAANGLNDRLSEALKALAMPTMPSIEDVHALLAYKDDASTVSKFDKRFGPGSAKSVIKAAETDDATAGLTRAVADLSAKVDAIGEGIAEAVSKAVSEAVSSAVSDAIAALPQPPPPPEPPAPIDLDALADRFAKAIPQPAPPPPPQPQPAAAPAPKPMDLAPLVQAMTTLARGIEELKSIAKAPRTVLTDMNGNVIGVKIEGS